MLSLLNRPDWSAFAKRSFTMFGMGTAAFVIGDDECHYLQCGIEAGSLV